MNGSPAKFLVDLGVGLRVEQYLVRAGYDVKSVRELNAKMSDEEILRLAVLENRMVVTMDKDFGELVYNSGRTHAGVLLLRLDEATGVEKVAVVSKIINKYSAKLAGCFCTYQNRKLRIRR